MSPSSLSINPTNCSGPSPPSFCTGVSVPASINFNVFIGTFASDPPISHSYNGPAARIGSGPAWQHSDDDGMTVMQVSLDFDCSTNTFRVGASLFSGEDILASYETAFDGEPYTKGSTLSITNYSVPQLSGPPEVTCTFSASG